MEMFPSNKDKVFLDYNFIDNPSSDINLTKWFLGAGSGVAPTTSVSIGPSDLVLSRNASTPLFGVADFKLSKPASNEQGSFLFTEFTIAKGFEYSPLKLEYLTRNSSLVDGDVKIFIIRKADNTVIEVSLNNVFGDGLRRHIFQSLASGTYQLVFWVSSDNASAWDLYLDQIKIKPNQGQLLANQSDLQPVTVTGSWTTNTTYIARAAREGQFAFFHVIIKTTGTPTSAGLTIDLPWNVDTSALGSADTANNLVVPLTRGSIRDAGANSYDVGVYYNGSNPANRLNINTYANSSNKIIVDGVNASNPFAFGNGDSIEVWFKVPIQGWTSGNKTIGDIAVNVPHYFEGSFSAATNPGNGDISFTHNKSYGPTYTSNSITIRKDGDYRISGSVTFNTNTSRYISVRVDGSNYSPFILTDPAGQFKNFSGILYGLKVGQIVTIYNNLNSGGGQNITGGGQLALYEITNGDIFRTFNRSTTKYLASNVTTSTADILSLKANGTLIPGRRYKVELTGYIAIGSASSSGDFTAIHNSVPVARAVFVGNASGYGSMYTGVGYFTAVTNTLTFSFAPAGSSTLNGNGGPQQTNITITEDNTSIPGNF